MAIGMFIFAAVDAQAKFLTENLHPVQITWSRQLGLLAGAIFMIVTRGRDVFATSHKSLQITRGVLASGSAVLFIFGIAYVPLADAIAITFVAPFVVTILGALLLGEVVGLRRWVAVMIGFIGTLIVLRPGLGVVHPAALLIVVAAIMFALRQILSRKLSSSDRTATTVVYTAITASVLLTLPLPFVWKTPQWGTEVALLISIAVMAGIAETLVIKAFELSQAVVLAPVHYSILIWGTMYGWLIFDQLPDGWTLLGAVVIIATGIYVLHRERLASQKPQSPKQ